jgi:hypothetical protein
MGLQLRAIWSDYVTVAKDIRKSLAKAYYHVTAYVPRRLPTNQWEFVEFKRRLIQYYGLEDRHDVWLTVCGHVTATPATKLRKSYGSIANAAKRLQVNKTAHDQKTVAIQALQVILEETSRRISEMPDSEIVKTANGETLPA